MAFKVSNETKVGALTAVSIALLILGFNFLKGHSLSSKTFLYSKFKSVDGLVVSNPVNINGFQVGTIAEIGESDENMSSILVKIKIVKDVKIPTTSKAIVRSNPLGTTTLEIVLDTLNTVAYAKDGDYLASSTSPGLLGGINDAIDKKLQPTIDQVRATLITLDTLLYNFNTVLDPNTKGNMQSVIANANKATASIVQSTASLSTLLNTQTGALAKSLDNVAVFSKSLADSRDKITGIMDNVEKTTATLSRMELDKTIRQMNEAVSGLKATIEKVNSTDGTLGSLINDKKMYNNLTSTINSMNLLMQDLRLHPKRYVNVSVFGKKDKSEPLMKPMSEDSITQEQIRDK